MNENQSTESGAKHITLDTYAKAQRLYHEKAQAAWKADIAEAMGPQEGGGYEVATDEEVLKVIEDLFADGGAE